MNGKRYGGGRIALLASVAALVTLIAAGFGLQWAARTAEHTPHT